MSVSHRLGPRPLPLLRHRFCLQCRYRLFSSLIYPLRSRPTSQLLEPWVRFGYRKVGTKLRKSLEELPQGLQAPLEPFIEKENTKYSSVIDEVLQNQRRFPKCVLLTRVGQFYEVVSKNSQRIDSSCTLRKQRRLHHY